MKTLFISSVTDAAGKNMVIAGIGQKMLSDKYRIGFFKPLANKPFREGNTLSDEDVLFFHKTFNLPDQIGNLACVAITDELIREIISGKTRINLPEKIKQCLAKITPDKDVMLVKGLGQIYRGIGLGLSESTMIKDFNWPTIMIDGYHANRFALPLDIIEGFITAKRLLGDLLIGVIFNYVPETQLAYLKEQVVPYLQKEHQIEVLGLIPADPRLKAVTVRELRDALNAELLSGADKQDAIIEDFCLSTMNIENDLKYFRQARCKGIIVGGDRTEIQLAALEAQTECLILTGKLYPADIILSRAEEKQVPVLVVRDNSLETAEKVERLRRHLGFYTPSKIPEAVKLTQKNVNIKAIYKKLGLIN